MTAPAPAPHTPRSRRARALLALLGLCLLAGFLALGTWQMQRRAWKLDLIERVEARVHAAPAAAPGPALWPAIDRAEDEYRRVQVTGHFEHDHETLVQASTVLGAGHWVLTPLRTAEGWRVLVNRGFVPPEAREPAARGATAPRGEVTVVGLVRLSEPGGGFLRDNDPAAGRWFSRDVAAIAQARHLAGVAPYFIDQGADPAALPGAAPSWPAPGLTVVRFRNHHLMYALTWYTLALMVVGAGGLVIRHDARRRKSKTTTTETTRTPRRADGTRGIEGRRAAPRRERPPGGRRSTRSDQLGDPMDDEG